MIVKTSYLESMKSSTEMETCSNFADTENGQRPSKSNLIQANIFDGTTCHRSSHVVSQEKDIVQLII